MTSADLLGLIRDYLRKNESADTVELAGLLQWAASREEKEMGLVEALEIIEANGA